MLAYLMVQGIAQQFEIKAETVQRWLRKDLGQGIVRIIDTDIGIDPDSRHISSIVSSASIVLGHATRAVPD